MHANIDVMQTIDSMHACTLTINSYAVSMIAVAAIVRLGAKLTLTDVGDSNTTRDGDDR